VGHCNGWAKLFEINDNILSLLYTTYYYYDFQAYKSFRKRKLKHFFTCPKRWDDDTDVTDEKTCGGTAPYEGIRLKVIK